MNRRTFLACIPALPIAALPAAKAAPLVPEKQQITLGKAGEFYVRALHGASRGEEPRADDR